MIFSKTFNSEIYSQIVVMLDVEKVFSSRDLVVTFYFYNDDCVHDFNVSFGYSDTGSRLRKEFFDGITAACAQSIVYDKLAEGNQ